MLLREKEEANWISFLTAALSCAGDGIIATDRDGIVRYINSSGEMLTGWNEKDAVGMPFEDIFPLIDYYSGDRINSPIKKVLNEGESSGLQNHAAMITKNGKRHFVSANCSPIFDFNDEIKGVVVSFRNIDRIKNIETALRVSRDEAASASRIKSEFIANMSHEVRTPLNGLIGMLDLLLRTDMDSEQTEYVRMAKLSANNLLKVISDILDLSKIEAGEILIKSVSFDIKALTDEIVKIYEVLAENKALKLNCKFSSKVPRYLVGDPDRLRQILNNLLGNAVKFTDVGTIDFDVEFITGSEKSIALEFRISDTGIGISREKMDMLFKRFSQVDGSVTRRHSGTGLGLAICKQLAELMGGSIEAKSEIGKGSTFVLKMKFTTGSEVPVKTTAVSALEQEQALSSIVTESEEINRLFPSEAAGEQDKVIILENDSDSKLCSCVKIGENGEIIFQKPVAKGDRLEDLNSLFGLQRELKAIIIGKKTSAIEVTAQKVKETALRLGESELADLAFKAQLVSRKNKWDEAEEYCVMMDNEINFRIREG